MIWGAITVYGIGILLPVEGNINLKKYCQIFQYGLLQVLDWFYPEGDYFVPKTMYLSIHLRKRGNVSKIAILMYLNGLHSHQI